MLRKNCAEAKPKRNDKVKSLSSVNKCFKLRDDVIQINPQQLFNRMICIATTTSKLEECLCYELSSYPKALFDEVSLNLCYELSPYPTALFDEVSLRKTTKSQLMTVLAKYSAPTLAVETYFVIDVDHLLHKVV